MPTTTRPHQADGNSAYGRSRSYRAAADPKRSRGRQNGNGNGNGGSRHQYQPNYQSSTKSTPPDATNAENFYYLKQMNAKTPMVVVMNDGERIEGCIEWYDRDCLKVNREGEPNLLIQKRWIKYLFKQDEL
ncbi:MAG TPA: hypothetical protein VF701_09580 [Thermoanaerobaculia bacterium]